MSAVYGGVTYSVAAGPPVTRAVAFVVERPGGASLVTVQSFNGIKSCMLMSAVDPNTFALGQVRRMSVRRPCLSHGRARTCMQHVTVSAGYTNFSVCPLVQFVGCTEDNVGVLSADSSGAFQMRPTSAALRAGVGHSALCSVLTAVVFAVLLSA